MGIDVGLDVAVFKSLSALEREFPGYRFEREPRTGECWVVHPDGVHLDWKTVTARDWRVGNILHVGALRETIAGHLGEESALERFVLSSGSHRGAEFRRARTRAEVNRVQLRPLCPGIRRWPIGIDRHGPAREEPCRGCETGQPNGAPTMTLTNRDIVELTEWRRKLHRRPEISNEEEKTAEEVVAFLADTGPDKVLTGRGGHG